ncbi:MAG TPA: segregation/condensation protein A [Anaerolineae bacterium]|jgi:segregation and condensation protein A|nr:segregation/condensation protein A [Anaerolineae bacterium]
MAYQVKLEVFEGPFDLLINLISRQKIDIYEIPIAEITNEYLDYVNSMQELDLEVSTEFLLIAATLLDIKAANLLPKEKPHSEDEISPHEAREILVARLIEYKKFKNVSVELSARYQAESKYYVRDVGLEERFSNLVPDFLAGFSLDRLRELFLAVNEKNEIDLVQADHITPKPLSVDEYVAQVEERLSRLRTTSFRELTSDCDGKVELITMFLAILELYKRGMVELGQAETFGDITVVAVDNTGVVV